MSEDAQPQKDVLAERLNIDRARGLELIQKFSIPTVAKRVHVGRETIDLFEEWGSEFAALRENEKAYVYFHLAYFTTVRMGELWYVRQQLQDLLSGVRKMEEPARHHHPGLGRR